MTHFPLPRAALVVSTLLLVAACGVPVSSPEEDDTLATILMTDAQAQAAARTEEEARRAAEAAAVAEEAALDAIPATYLQVGTFLFEENATSLARSLTREGFPARSQNVEVRGVSVARVIVGPYSSRAALARAEAEARRRGIEDAFPTRG